ncbi:hypothetical protein NIES4074_02650 [Cylindrospermum sp. NIES-4074]|nr:hypothetical protein NIES4074_02650 [Cylindrospermum sp. NIES-4074]
MSQDNENSQRPSSPKPRGNKPERKVKQVTQPPKKPYQRVTPFWKASIIQVLKGTIGVLETTVVKLETEQPSSGEKKPTFLQRFDSSLARFLRTVRLFLPSSLSNNLSDVVLAGILAGITVVIIGWTTLAVFTGKPVEIATVPPVEEVPAPTPTVTTPPVSAAPEPPPEVFTVLPEPTAAPEVFTVLPEPTAAPEVFTVLPEPTAAPEVFTVLPEPTATPQAEAEPTPEAIPEPEPTPIPEPVVELTPEQSLIAAIEKQVEEISDRLSAGLIKSTQANFRTSNLTIKISNDWYTLEAPQQDKLATDILQRAKELNFSHLEIIDSQNKLIARNPVVGNKMVIFKRRESIVSELDS